MATVPQNQSASFYATLLNQQYPGNLSGRNYTLAQAYTSYLQKNPGTDPFSAYNEVVTGLEELGAVPAAIAGAASAGVTGAANAAAAIPAAVSSLSPLTGLAAIGDFFQRLTQASLWERVGEVVLGLILIAVGVAHLTHAVPLATKVAKAAGGAVALA